MNKLLHFFILFILFISVIVGTFTTNVIAESTYSTGFESTDTPPSVLNSPYGSPGDTFYTQEKYPGIASREQEVDLVGRGAAATRGFNIASNSLADGWWNYTYSATDIITDWQTDLFIYSGASGSYLDFKFSDSNDVLVIHLRIHRGSFFYYDHNGVQQDTGLFTGVEPAPLHENYNWHTIGFTINHNQSVTYFLNSTTFDGTPRTIMPNPRIKYSYLDNLVAAGNGNWSLDNHLITVGELEEIAPTGQTIYIKIFDKETTQAQTMYSNGLDPLVKSVLIGVATGSNIEICFGDIYSDLWGLRYCDFKGGCSSYQYGHTITLDELTFTNGDYHWLNITDIFGYVDGKGKSYYDNKQLLQLYNGQTYIFQLSDTEPEEFYKNCNTNTLRGGFVMSVCTDKKWYLEGDTVLIKYKLPTIKYLFDNDYKTDGWELWIYDTDEMGILWWVTDGGVSADFKIEQPVFDGQYHYFVWAKGGATGYKNVTTGVDEYRIMIGRNDWPWDSYLFGPERLPFFIQSGTFTSYGNITSISPTEPELGQLVNITFNANNNGNLYYKKLSDPSGIEHKITTFTKFTGSISVNHQFWEFGYYELKLYVWNGYLDVLVDSLVFGVNITNGTAGGYGYNIEFLVVQPEIAVAGYDTMKISYKTLKDDTEIRVVDSRGQQTMYGTVVNQGSGTHEFVLPNWASIGNWNVTLFTNDTLKSTFNVVADENNYLLFQKNEFYDNEDFSIYLKHDKKILLTFSKDGIEKGEDIFMETSVNPDGSYIVPETKVKTEIGYWTVQMWEVNNLVKIKLLSEDNCYVITAPPEPIKPGTSNILSMLSFGGDMFGGGKLGLAFMALFFIFVVEIVMAKSMKGNKNSDKILFMVGFAFMLFFSAIGWLPLWISIVAIILTSLMFGAWGSKKLISLGGS